MFLAIDYLKETITRKYKTACQKIRSWYTFDMPVSCLLKTIFRPSWEGNKAVSDKIEALLADYEADIKEMPTPLPAADYRIWVMWWQGEKAMPDIIKACYHALLRNADHEVVLLSKDNVEQWIEIPDYIKRKIKSGYIDLTHLSDYIRCALLCDWGGLWIDSSIYTFEKCKEYQKYPVYYRATWLMGTNMVKHPLFYLLKHDWEEHWKRYRTVVDYWQLDYMIRDVVKRHESLGGWNNFHTADYPKTVRIYDLIDILNEPYDLDKWKEIMEQNAIQKLSWKKRVHFKTKQGKTTFGGYIIESNKGETP